MATHSTSAAMPPFPGTHQIFATRGLSFSFHTSACSRPPPPSTRIFIRNPSSTTLSNDRRPSWTCQLHGAAGRVQFPVIRECLQSVLTSLLAATNRRNRRQFYEKTVSPPFGHRDQAGEVDSSP